jgi:hypothetical protein
MLIAGVGYGFKLDNGAGIPALWHRFHQEVDSLPGRIGRVAYGVCCNGDDAGNFDYIAGVEVTDFSDLPREFSRVRIPARRYAVFTHKDHISTPPHRQHDLEQLAAGLGSPGGRRAQFRALRRKVRSRHRQWRSRNLDTDRILTASQRCPAAARHCLASH